jgi:hypothetical protein
VGFQNCRRRTVPERSSRCAASPSHRDVAGPPPHDASFAPPAATAIGRGSPRRTAPSAARRPPESAIVHKCGSPVKSLVGNCTKTRRKTRYMHGPALSAWANRFREPVCLKRRGTARTSSLRRTICGFSPSACGPMARIRRAAPAVDSWPFPMTHACWVKPCFAFTPKPPGGCSDGICKKALPRMVRPGRWPLPMGMRGKARERIKRSHGIPRRAADADSPNGGVDSPACKAYGA